MIIYLMKGKALREIEYYQRHADCFILARGAFQRLCREIADDLAKELARSMPPNATQYTMSITRFTGRFMREAMIVLQLAAERFITDTFAMA